MNSDDYIMNSDDYITDIIKEIFTNKRDMVESVTMFNRKALVPTSGVVGASALYSARALK